ncbi:MAG: hypothetical protein ACLTTP_10330 [Alistipes ihumii]
MTKRLAEDLPEPAAGVMLQIVEDNYASRPIFLRMGNPFFFAGLDRFFSHGGLVSRLLPFHGGHGA